MYQIKVIRFKLKVYNYVKKTIFQHFSEKQDLMKNSSNKEFLINNICTLKGLSFLPHKKFQKIKTI